MKSGLGGLGAWGLEGLGAWGLGGLGAWGLGEVTTVVMKAGASRKMLKSFTAPSLQALTPRHPGRIREEAPTLATQGGARVEFVHAEV